VQTGSNVMIGGFRIDGTGTKTVLIRARGPFLAGAPFNLSGVLADPSVKLYSGATVIAQSDNWQTTDPLCGLPITACGNATQITATGKDPCRPNPGQTVPPPNCSKESALLVTLPPGAYTAIVRGVNNGTGLGMVEVFEADTVTTARLSNVSTRVPVLTGNNVLIGGFIIGGSTPKSVVIRGRGPALGGAPFNLPGVLANPIICLYSGSTVITCNDDWQSPPECPVGKVCILGGAVINSIPPGYEPCRPNPGQTVAPPNCVKESALAVTLPPGPYTVIVRGVNNTTGLGMVEVFDVGP
jgi:hypothetical protein